MKKHVAPHFTRFVVIGMACMLVGVGALGYAWHRVAEARSNELRIAQLRECNRVNRIINDYNKQYGVIYQSLVDLTVKYPNDPISARLVQAFQSPSFPLVKPSKCKIV